MSAPRRGVERRASLAGTPENRQFTASSLHVTTRSASSGSNVIELSGTPIVYSRPYVVQDALGSFSETMAPGVVRSLLGSPGLDCRFLFDHSGLPLARCPGTMTLKDTPSGLTFNAKLDKRQGLANDLAIAIQRGDVSQMSCGFVVGQDSWNASYTVRTIFSLKQLLDVSAVTYPASPTTSIGIAQPDGSYIGASSAPPGLYDGTGSRSMSPLALEAANLRRRGDRARLRALEGRLK